MTVSGHIPPPNKPPEDLPEPMQPKDDPFLERLFGTMCRFIYMLPQESFVDLFRRWIEVFHHMADLKPRTHHEWLLASDVTMQHLFAQHSLALGRTKGMRMKQRMQHSKDFITFSKTLHAAQLRYNLARTRPIA